MTLGERIAALRKERGLSQEALGELVGVTRQAVSKWEADKALPDVDNCIAMSRVFQIPLTRLLDIEDMEDGEADGQPAGLNEQQTALAEKLAERMAEQYVSAQKRARRRWRWPVILLGCALLVGGIWLWEWLGEMNRTIDYLSGELAGLRGEIVAGVGDRVEETLEEERSLVTRYTGEVSAVQLDEGTVTISLSVTLKEGGGDTAVSFVFRGGGGMEIIPAAHQGGLTYTAELTCTLMDEPPIDLLVEREGVSRSQPLWVECYENDYDIQITANLRWASLLITGLSEGAIEAAEYYVFLNPARGLPEPLRLTALDICIFRNDTLHTAIPQDLSLGTEGVAGDWSCHQTPEIPVPADIGGPGDTITFAVLAEDNYGRKASAIISRYRVLEGGQLEDLTHEMLELDDGTYGTEGWR